uniref:Plant heme peroxidase family profile domain-containing protein n=1 Tax=Tetradesmus obliquus TaxID=3088 RepID=A0A383W9J5_TETOB|eukprot:jgi/Sobl393_1/4888/SZX73850.1
MALASKSLTTPKAFVAGSKPVAIRPRLQVSCKASNEGAARRDVLLAGAAAAATLLQSSPAAAATREMAVSSLSTFQKAAQRTAFQTAAEGALKPLFKAEDATGLLALMLHDAATYDAETKTGGYDGSILINSEELNRPENAYLKPLAARVKEAKAAVDAAVDPKGEKISYADLLVLATKVATTQAWKAVKMQKTQTTSGGEIITTVYGTEWPVRLGRVDSAAAGAAGRLPAADAPVAEITAFMGKLGVKEGSAGAGPFTPKPPFWERPTFFIWPAAAKDPAAEEARFAAEDPANFAGVKRDMDRSRGTLTRTDYEVEFINTFTKLAAMGATFNPDAYLHTETTLQLKF